MMVTVIDTSSKNSICFSLYQPQDAVFVININKRSKNFHERPHRRIVTPRGGEWIRPTLTPI